ncbi:ABC transporter ATP-binding protein/permease [Candidatus Comchoanobacter bicostacola]|uniref:ABC transporter ATP-binding protein/permease n=1 Tax=Candidatus Comchoanobacter bicostacola TaxID=2919598 RepID=A0ABY5DMF2_9GAMM|nr:ABC transporter ATP-binding protein [Candidatus Comchoanobacter bicostacola]UTC24724.1 ABC transporter ATP-binding protein/permease [Candidatus Comchoanobacter bicostacola]
MASTKNQLIHFIIKQLRSFRFRIGILGILTLYNAFFWTYSPYILKTIIDSLTDYNINMGSIWTVLAQPLFLFIFTWLLVIISYRIEDVIDRHIMPTIRKNIITSMFAYGIQHTHKFFQNDFSGSIANRIMDMQNGSIAIISHTKAFIFNLLLFVIGFIFLYNVHPYIWAIMLTWSVIFISIGIYYSPKILVQSRQFSQQKTKLIGHIVDAIGNVSTIRMFARNSLENQLLESETVITKQMDQDVRLNILKMRIWWEITIIVTISGFMLTLVDLYSQGLVTVGDFAFVTNTYIGMIHNIWHLMNNYVQFSEEVGKCNQALTIMQPIGMYNKKDAYPLEKVKGHISFNQVHFNYEENTKMFENKQLTITEHQKVGLVGFSGSGKTSFINLITRLYDIQAGQIKIDEHDISDVTMTSLREHITIIPQEPILFHRTLMENIQYGKPDASIEEIIEASKKAHCHEFISKLPEGYDTMVGERGVKISGGQRQRIAIARAFLKQAPILILDEATSALDSVTETYIQDSLEHLMADKTTLVIAHRLSTLRKMDRILVFDNGAIVEDGTHTQLLRNKKSYARMWAMQSGGFITEDDTL